MALTCLEKFDKLVTSFDTTAVCRAPNIPSETGTYIVCKVDPDWKHCGVSWRNYGLAWHTITKNEDVWVTKKAPSHKQVLHSDENGYFMKTVYYRPLNEKYKDVKRIVTEIEPLPKSTMEPISHALIEYFFPGNKDAPVTPKKTKGRPFIPTAPSTKKKIIEAVASNKGPTAISVDIYNQRVLSDMPGALPKSIEQIKYYRNKMRKDTTVADEDFNKIFEYCRKDGQGKQILRNLQFHSEGIRFVMCTEAQLEEIVVSCCTLNSPCGVLCIDTTFNIGSFYVTPTTYPIYSVTNRRTRKSVNVPGPCLFHEQEEDKEVYRYFANSLVELNEEMKNIRFVGGDRGKGQYGFLSPFHLATFLPCTRHMQGNIQAKLNDMDLYREVINDIFGSSYHQRKGLVDCEREQFDGALDSLYQKWPEYFVTYFKTYLVADIKEGMLPDVRRAVGLESELFYNNALECLNKKIKVKKVERQLQSSQGTSHKELCSWSEAVEIYKELLFENRCFIQQAVIGRGPFVLAKTHEHLRICELQFSSMNIEEKRTALAKIDRFLRPNHISFFRDNGGLESLLYLQNDSSSPST